MRQLRHRKRRQEPVIETLSTVELLALHDRFFSPLALQAKLRITQSARINGWDRGWGVDGLAA
jgi:hypothetical protein